MMSRTSSACPVQPPIAKHRSLSPEQLQKAVRGDLDWIVMKALEKDRARRYETSSSLSDDVKRFLDDQPVQACPPSPGYRFRKFVRRNRALLTSACAVGLALSCATVMSTWFAWRSAELAAEADRSKEAALEAQRIAEDERGRAVRALKDWRYELIDRGIEASLRGDLDATREIMEKAAAAEVPKEWLLLLEGLAHNFSDDSVKAGVLIRQAYQENPENLAVVASLLMTRSSEGSWNQNQYEDLATLLVATQPSGEFKDYEKLFVGWSKVYTDPAESLQMIREVIDARDRPWPIATLFRAHAEAHVAIDTTSPYDLELALLAVEHATEADKALESNAFSKSINAWARLMVMPFIEESDPSKFEELRNECSELVEALKGNETAVQAAGLICMFYDMTDDPRADDAFARLEAEDWWGACRAAFLFRNGKVDSATAIISNDVEFRPFATIVKYTIAAAQGKSEDAMKGYEKIKAAHKSSYVRAFAMQIPAVAGDLKTASQDAHQWLSESEVPDFPFHFAHAKLAYFADPATQATMFQTVEKYRLGSCYAHYAIAVSHFRTNPELAGDHFRECVKTNLFWAPEYCMAKAFLAQCPELHRNNADQVGQDE